LRWLSNGINYATHLCNSTDRYSETRAIAVCAGSTSGTDSTNLIPTYSAFDPATGYYTVTALSGNVDEKVNTNGQFRIYDLSPYVVKFQTSVNNFNHKFTFGSDNYYLIIEPRGSQINIKGVNVASISNLLEISNAQPNRHYQITQNGILDVTGVTASDGTINLTPSELNLSGNTVGILKIYDSLVYRGSFSTVIFDYFNNQTIHIDTPEDKTYAVHQYSKIPVVGTVTINGTNLDGTLYLPYLDKEYVRGDVYVPVIPGYSTINMTINGLNALIDYADVLGNSGIKIADPATSTIPQYSATSEILSSAASAGTVASVFANSNGVLNAIITETISGTVSITNTYTLEQIPPLTPPPVRRDPLTGVVTIFVNGAQVQQTTLGVNPYPNFVQTNTVNGNVVTRSVTYSYPDYVVSGNASVDVFAGDLVEFYVSANIHGDIDSYSAPAGHIITTSSGISSATANIRSAQVNTD